MKKTKATKIVLSLCLIAVLAIGGTLAYLNARTNTMTNTFTFYGVQDPSNPNPGEGEGDIENAGVNAKLIEPNWDEANGKNLVPGTTVAKDPQVQNTGDLDAYVALRLTFQKADGSTLSDEEMTRVAGLLKVKTGDTAKNAKDGYNTTKWTADAATAGKAQQIWYCNDVLAKSGTTAPLFNFVDFASSISNEDYFWLSSTLKGVNIKIEGAAIQAKGFDNAAAAQTELKALFK